jgi:hypothetical protein
LKAVALAARIRIFTRPLFEFRNTHSLRLIHFETFLNELFGLFRDRNTISKPNRHSGHFINELAFGFTLPRSLSMQQFVNDNPNRPNIVFDWVDVLL